MKGKAFEYANFDEFEKYSQENFLYYFENRLNQIVKNEVEAIFRECFYGLPF